MTEQPAKQAPNEATEHKSPYQAVGTAAHLLRKSVSSGDRAELRRISPERPFTPALWKLLLDMDQHDAPPWSAQEQWERRWATLLMGLAFCAELHDYTRSLGSALAEAGYSELRLVRLLRAEGEQLEVHLRRLAQYPKSTSAAWHSTFIASSNQPTGAR
ncbi:MAG: hypothetical protein GVY12_00305 [Bacteroidetes bacterium]|jgi:CRISPR system Cascade subunit CasB|nr:hypothetical protein [Bacteroidota bacterium]